MQRCIQCTVCTSVFYEQSTLLLLDNSVFSCTIACSMYVFGRPLFLGVWTQRFHRDSRSNLSLSTLYIFFVCSRFTLFYFVTSLRIRMHLLSIFFRKSSAQIEFSSSYIVGFLKYSTELERSMDVMGT